MSARLVRIVVMAVWVAAVSAGAGAWYGRESARDLKWRLRILGPR